jgi:hypothetical protein
MCFITYGNSKREKLTESSKNRHMSHSSLHFYGSITLATNKTNNSSKRAHIYFFFSAVTQNYICKLRGIAYICTEGYKETG